ncbi:MFS transporter, partial [Pseudomonas cedrina subsp. fulgida]|nr:MFS transporter [Pseudomonas cedrina subsp. fulgida]
MPDTQRPMAVTLQVVSIVLFTFIGYLNIGIPLAVLPGYVHSELGFGAVIAGLVISVQYLATLLSRPYAGKLIDTLGSKRAVLIGLAGCGLSGVFMLLAAWFSSLPALSLGSLLIGRLVLGSAESLV